MWSLGYRNQAIQRLRFLVNEGILCKIYTWRILCNYLINTKPITIKNNKNKLYKTEKYYNNKKTYTYIHIYVHAYIYIDIRTSKYVHTYIHVYVHTYTRT